MKKILSLILALMLIASVFATGAFAEEKSKVANIAMSENATGIDFHVLSNMGTTCTVNMCMERLVCGVENEDGTYSYAPMLATSWESNEDGTEWTFYLREGVKFHNGEIFDANDVACTFQRLIDNAELLNVATQYWLELDHYEVVDEHTFKIYLKNPLPTLLFSVDQTYIMEDKAWNENGEDYINKQLMYGTGPWIFQEWIDGEYAHYVKNEDYWNKEAYDSYFDEVYLRYITEESTGISALLSGDIDLYARTTGYATENLALFAGHDDIELLSNDLTTVLYLGFQCGEGSVFSDINVRKAFSMAIDRQSIVDYILGRGSVANGYIVKGVYGYDENQPAYEYDPEQAAELLANSSYNGEPIVISSNTGTPQSGEVLTVIAEMAQEVGFNITMEVVESATLLEMRTTGNYDVFMVNVQYQASDPGSVLTQRVLNDYHCSNYVNEELNALVAQSNIEMDVEARTELLRQINNIIREEYAPQVGLTQQAQTIGQYKGMTGANYYQSGTFLFEFIDYDPSLA